MNFIQSQQITIYKLRYRKFNCVNKISGYKYIQIIQLNERINGKYIARNTEK